ncbi:LPXTG cell wall anchor domain-containing protein [Enterococcus sp. DIV0187]|uniref:LPXTG cell wall anchor domain-containing protein n=1 Tax=Enterococcus sp. DIV0187 TaxID=2774644 RepID=UPI003F22A4DD
MKKNKMGRFFRILTLAILLIMVGGVCLPNTVIGETEVGVGFVEGSSGSSTSSSDTKSTDTRDSSSSISSESSKSSETDSIYTNPNSPRAGGGTNRNIPTSEGDSKILPSTGDKKSSLWLVLGLLLVVCAYSLNRIYERRRL